MIVLTKTKIFDEATGAKQRVEFWGINRNKGEKSPIQIYQ